MMKNYFKRSLLLMGAAAFVGMAHAEYVDVTRQYIKDPTFVPEWQGSIGNVAEGVCETWNAAFQTYQNLGVMPAGKYVLTVNAFYRCGNNDYARDNQVGNPDLNTCYIFINDAKQTVAPLQDGRENRPNSMWDANQAFQAGDYLNTVEYDHKGGVLVIGIRNTGCYWDEWCCFDNFKLTCDGVDVPVANGDFEQGGIDAKRSWDNKNSGGSEKTPDAQKDGSGGGDYRKCGGSPYNTAQQVTLPAGKYRFGMQCFHRYGSTVDAEGNYYNHKWPLGLAEAYGSMKRTPKDWFEANDYDQVGDENYSHAYIFMSKNEEKPKSLAWSESEAEGDLNEATDVRTRVRDCWEICNGDLTIMPQNNPMCLCVDNPDYNPAYEQKNKAIWGNDSGSEREAGAAFVNEPSKWYQYVEFTLDEETTVWLGLGKDENSGDGYWHAYANIRLEVLEGEEEDPNIDPDTNRSPVMIDWNEDDQFVIYADDFYCEGGVVYDEDEAAFVFDGETLGHICLDLNGKALDMSEVASIEVKGSYLNTANDAEGTFGPGAWGGDDPIATLLIARTLDGKFNTINEWWGSRYSINFNDFANVADKVTKFQFNGRAVTETEGEGDDAVTTVVGYVPGYAYIDEVVFTKTQELDPMGITGEWWHEWDNWDETANIVASNLGYCGVELNKALGGGAPFAGVLNGTVPGNVYADFTQYAGIYVKGTPGTPWRGLFNRQSLEDAGDYKNVIVELNEDGEAEIIFSQIPELEGETYIHLNTVKINWGAPEGCKITKFNYIEGAGIENVVVTTPYNGKMYNLQGIEVNDSYKGMVIKNGVKFFNK